VCSPGDPSARPAPSGQPRDGTVLQWAEAARGAGFRAGVREYVTQLMASLYPLSVRDAPPVNLITTTRSDPPGLVRATLPPTRPSACRSSSSRSTVSLARSPRSCGHQHEAGRGSFEARSRSRIDYRREFVVPRTVGRNRTWPHLVEQGSLGALVAGNRSDRRARVVGRDVQLVVTVRETEGDAGWASHAVEDVRRARAM
jgi:hypothetical protein